MKKIGLSLAVIFAFVFYSWHQRNEIASAPVIVSTKTHTNISPTLTPPAANNTASMYKDGTYTGSVADAFYGNIQVQVTISKGKINDVQFLQYPNDRGTSIAINQQADPILTQEAI
ncbi:MAG: FMN-binding protein, partial [Nitrosotalea sp.]